MRLKNKLNPDTFDRIEYDFSTKTMCIHFKESITLEFDDNGKSVFLMQNHAKIKASYEKYCENCKKWLGLRLNLSNYG